MARQLEELAGARKPTPPHDQRQEIRRAARIVGLRDLSLPSLEAVEDRRAQLSALSTVLLGLLGLAVVVSFWSVDYVGDSIGLVLRFSLLALALAFGAYSFEKERHLRRLSELLLEERTLTVALSSRVRELTLLLDASKAVNSALDLDSVLQAILTSALELLDASSTSVMLLEDGELRTVCSAGNVHAADARVRLGEGISGRVALSREPLLITGQAQAAQFPGLERRSYPVDSAMSVPIVHVDELLGVVNITARGPREFTEYDLRAFSVFAEQAASAIVKARLLDDQRTHAEAMSHMAFHDPLTSLPNRSMFVERAHQALARAQHRHGMVAVLFIDLDRFKGWNDSYGHAVGDELLARVASALRDTLRPEDILARFGGDEFIVLCEGLEGELEALGLATRLQETVSQPFTLSVGDAHVTASVGIALAVGPDDDPEALLRDADTAMYRAKEKGRDRCEVFNSAMRARATKRLEVENILAHAVERDYVRVEYQPVVAMTTGDLVGVEALVRLEHPERGLMMPADFLDVAEETGFIVPLGYCVLEAACREAAAWSADLGYKLFVSVNLSAAQVARSDLAQRVHQSLESSKLDPKQLHLEITETALAQSSPSALSQLRVVTEAGVHLGIDDFGTGYSSLTYLRQFPVDFVKIDRSFVKGVTTDAEDAAIIEAVIRLSRALGLTTVAEGVETCAQRTRLLELGCDLGQGFGFSRPVPPDALRSLLVTNGGLLPLMA